MVREALWRLSPANRGRSAVLAAGCMTPVGVKRIRPQEAKRQLTASVLTTGKPGAPAQEFLYRLNLIEKYRADPPHTIADLHAGLGRVVEYTSAHIDGVASESRIRHQR